MALRTALGAGLKGLLRPLLLEGMLLAFAAGVVGLLLVASVERLVVAVSPVELPRLEQVRLDAGGVGVTLLLVVAAGGLLASLPWALAARLRLGEWLRESGARTSGDRRAGRAAGLLVVSQIALAFVLLVSAAATVRSFRHLLRIDPGFDPHGLVTAKLWLTQDRYAEAGARTAFLERVSELIAAIPGVTAVGGATTVPLEGADIASEFEIAGRPALPSGEVPVAGFDVATAGYFETLRIPIVEGRGFDARDAAEAPPVAVINEALVRRYWPGEHPVGQRVLVRIGPPVEREIVGVVGDVRHGGLGAEARPAVYVPYHQFAVRSLRLVVRSAVATPSSLVPQIRHAVLSVDPEQPLGSVTTLEALRVGSLARERFSSALLGVFAGLGMVLAGVGLYSLMAQSVTRRMGEIGIRIALGADRGAVMRMVLGRGLRLALLGVGAGLLLALPVVRLLASWLPAIGASAPGTVLLTAAVLVALALAAGFLPARRAASLDPVRALRG
jgi:putative ABC transport system permease protein